MDFIGQSCARSAREAIMLYDYLIRATSVRVGFIYVSGQQAIGQRGLRPSRRQ